MTTRAIETCTRTAPRAGRRPALIAAALASLLAPRLAAAQAAGPDVDVDFAIDGAITGGALALSLASTLIPVKRGDRWNSELFGGLDMGVRANFSATAAKLSDALVAATIAAPVLLQLDRGTDEDAGRRLLLYGESISIALALNAITKYTVGRPRPYNYNGDARVAAYAEEAGKDAYLSFFSGHAALSFAAAVSGSYLYSIGSTDDRAKAAVWGLELGLAAATANMRVRAGKHFYSDVLTGALIGAAVGFAVPALHAEGGVYEPSGAEIGAMAGGLAAGLVVSQLLPLRNDVVVPLPEATGSAGLRDLRLVPVAARDAAGVGVAGLF